MFVRLVLFNFGVGMREAADELAADLGPQIRELSGCKSVTFFGDDTDGQYGLFVLWESQEHADSAAGVIAPQLMSHLAGKVTGEPSRRLYSVIG
jgi:hypothetical protein